MVMGDMELSTDLLVIGAGPGGYGAAFRAADQGLDVVMVDPFPTPGGFCLYSGCIGSKVLLNMGELIFYALNAEKFGVHFPPPRIDFTAMQDWKNGAIQSIGSQLTTFAERRSIMLLTGKAHFDSSNSARIEGSEYSRILFKHAVIATGSRARELTGLPFSDSGRILSPVSALQMSNIPRELLVIGNSFSALELGELYAHLGTKITLISEAQEVLPDVDPDLVQPLKKRLKSLFDMMYMQCTIRIIEETATGIAITFNNRDSDINQSFEKVLVANEPLPNTSGLGLENTHVGLDDKGYIICDDRQQTDDSSIYACGDVCGGPLSAHKAIREGRIAAETICGLPSGFDVRALVSVIYTDPQISWCGLTERAAQQENISYTAQCAPWQYSNRAQTLGSTTGLTKLIIEPDSGRILGGGVSGRGAEILIGEIALAIEMGAVAEDLALTLHPHPSLSEMVSEAAEFYMGHPLQARRAG